MGVPECVWGFYFYPFRKKMIIANAIKVLIINKLNINVLIMINYIINNKQYGDNITWNLLIMQMIICMPILCEN